MPSKTRRTRRALVPVLAAAAAMAVGAIASAPADAATYTVRNINDSGPDSLRQAIDDANTNVGVTDAIEFDIPGKGYHVIPLGSDLPTITDPVNIRGYVPQPGSAPATTTTSATITILINASNARNGLVLQTDDSSISGLVIGNAGTGVASLPAGDGDGIKIVGNGNRVRGNHIGTERTTFLGGNLGDGVDVTGDNNKIGSPVAEDRNVIAANGPLTGTGIDANGVRINGSANKVQGSRIGTDPDVTTSAVGNRGAGVHIESGDHNHVGGTVAGAGNLISANVGAAIDIAGSETTVAGNTIGADLPPGLSYYGNGKGVVVEAGSTKNVIGTPNGDAGNLIVNTSTGPGIDLAGDSNLVLNNVIGVDDAQVTALANSGGIYVTGRFNVIGGQTVNTGNVVSGNLFNGIQIGDTSDPAKGSDNVVWGNDIGTDENALTDVGNSGDGVKVLGGDANLIGGTGGDGGKANVIAHNDGAGVNVKTGALNAIVKNLIFDNGGLGIDLAGDGQVNSNDASDTDPGPNGLQNFPLITAVDPAAGTVDWDISDFSGGSRVSTEIDFYSSPVCDASGHGEGQTLIGSVVLPAGTPPGTGSTTMTVPVGTGEFVTAVATSGIGVPLLPGRTSEFSACFPT